MSDPIYSLRVPQVYDFLESSPQGLSTVEANARLSLYGENRLEQPASISPWRKLSSTVTHPMAILLWLAGLLSFIVGDFVLGIFIWIVVLTNAAFSFWQEHQATQKMDVLLKMLPDFARVLRDGSESQIKSTDLVPGDLLILAEGDHISADARVLEAYGLRCNQSTLTGEALPASKTADASLREEISEIERPNLIFAGSSIVSGTGKAIVYASGMSTQFGRIARLSQAVTELPSAIQQQLFKVTRRTTWVALLTGLLILVLGWIEFELGVRNAILLALGIVVALVPEGLPATITLSLALAAQRLAQRGVLVKKLATTETLGNVSVVCTDKSGTLTQNQMTAGEIWIAGQRIHVSGVGYEPKGDLTPSAKDKVWAADLHWLFMAATLCNNSRLNPPTPEKPTWSCLGDQTEAALRVLALKGKMDEEHLRVTLPRVHELPFDARRKLMSTIHIIRQSSKLDLPWIDQFPEAHQIVFTKGAPREVLQLCSHISWEGRVVALDERIRAQILSINDDYARRVLRVLALACRPLPARSGSYTTENVEKNLVFIGLVGMMDPPRPEVAQAVQTLKQAGVKLVMVTGDYGLTASSFARRIGMLNSSNPLIITGADLDTTDDLRLKSILEKDVVYARMAPEHKVRLVQMFQAKGEVVAVVGDGVNDAPAMRKADIGVAMGVTGTDVAKEAADIILATDNFSYIVNAIEEGRTIFDNLRKFITYIFASNIPELMPFILTGFLRIPLALGVHHILAIDLGTDLLPALALGSEPPEPDTLRHPPNRRGQLIVDQRLLLRAFSWLGLIEAGLCYLGFVGVYALMLPLPRPLSFSTLLSAIRTAPVEITEFAVTIYFAGVIFTQIGNAFACRYEHELLGQLGLPKNPKLIGAIIFEIGLLIMLLYFPPLAKLFHHRPLPAFLWLYLIAAGITLYLLELLRKGISRQLFALKNKFSGKENHQ